MGMAPATPEDIAKYARLVAIVQRCGTIHSRLKLHKIVYILKSLGHPVREAFEFRDYGPWSADLASELRSAVNADYLTEHTTQTSQQDDEEPYRRYDYSVGRRSSDLVSKAFSANPTLAVVADGMAKIAEELSQFQPSRLELVATLMFLQDRNVPANLIPSVLQSQKPQFTDNDIRLALEFIVELRNRASFAPPLDLSSIIGLVKEGPPSDAAQDLDEEIYGGE
jgi:uncharacterized protein YwgA